VNTEQALDRIRPFNLSRWFAVVGLISIGAISGLAGWAMSYFVTAAMLKQEGALTQQFVQTLVLTEPTLSTYLTQGEVEDRRALELALAHIGGMTDMLRANLYDRRQKVVWSTDPSLTGRAFGANHELDEALAGELVVHQSTHEEEGEGKREHEALARRADLFVEIYVPLHDPADGSTIGVIEFYKNPQALFAALEHLRMYVALGAAVAGLLLFFALAGLVRRAEWLLRAQERRLLDTETMAVIGEMSAAVAHGIRNPLASIRSSAELIPGADTDSANASARDIVAESDRLEAWVRDLLAFSRPLEALPVAIGLPALIQRCLEDFERDAARRQIRLETDIEADLPSVRGDALMIGQVLHSLVANALEAVGEQGLVRIDARVAGRMVSVTVRDDGPGMSEAQLQRVGKPFFTTKTRGLGVGLSQARRIAERYGGHLLIDSVDGGGTQVTLGLPTMEA